MNSEERSNIIEIWKTVVEVQQHFNDIGMKIRGLFITIVVAIAAAQGFLLEKRLFFFNRSCPNSICYRDAFHRRGSNLSFLFHGSLLVSSPVAGCGIAGKIY